jgi:hypothetical protein
MGLAGADLGETAQLGEMAELVHDGALLRNQQQQQSERFEQLSHSNDGGEF